ncbi:MAG: DUF2490 domain-containing protein [Parvularculaceae bacterium]|nr:DUF2490 domain-containing protein [Parvularculaceae bacterium]
MMNSKAVASLAAMTLSMTAPSHAQDESDFQAWSAVFLTARPAETSRLLLWFDGHARFRDDAGDLGVSILRPGVGWRVSDGLDLWTGYARVVSRSDGAADVEEHRLWQQATYPVTGILGGRLTGRTRLEQRFRDSGEDTGWRVRQFVRWERRIEGSPFSVLAADELFINVNDADWGQQSGFDQNRLFIGGALRLSKWSRFEGGYLNNIINLAGSDDRMNHNIFFQLFVNL